MDVTEILSPSGCLNDNLVLTSISTLFVNNRHQLLHVSAAAVALFSEIMAKLNKAPVNMYLIVGIIPLVPGGLAYYAMLALVTGDNATFLERAVDAFGIAGSVAMGIFAVSSAVRLFKDFRRQAKIKADKAYRTLSKNDKSVKKF